MFRCERYEAADPATPSLPLAGSRVECGSAKSNGCRGSIEEFERESKPVVLPDMETLVSMVARTSPAIWNAPPAISVEAGGLSLAGFDATLYGRFEVIPESQRYSDRETSGKADEWHHPAARCGDTGGQQGEKHQSSRKAHDKAGQRRAGRPEADASDCDEHPERCSCPRYFGVLVFG